MEPYVLSFGFPWNERAPPRGLLTRVRRLVLPGHLEQRAKYRHFNGTPLFFRHGYNQVHFAVGRDASGGLNFDWGVRFLAHVAPHGLLELDVEAVEDRPP